MLNKSSYLLSIMAGFISVFISASVFAAETTNSSADESPAAAEDAAAPEKTVTPEKVDAPAVTTTTETTSTTTKEVAPAPAVKMPLPALTTKMSDKVVKNEVVGDEKTTFTKDTPEIFVIVTTSEAKPGQVFRSEWIADDSKGVAPPNYKIDEKSLEVSKEMQPGKTFTANFSLSKPTAGWPVGDYHLDIYVDKAIAKTIKFKIQ
jgi:hypothetical protein